MQKSKSKNSNLKAKVLLFLKISLVTLYFAYLYFPSSIFAHETESSNGIGAILHIDPGDAPIAGQKSTLFFEFTDMEGKLDLNNCLCSLQITKDGQEVFKQEFTGMPGTEGTSGTFDYTFPQAGVYKATVIGHPKEEGQFKAFKLNYSVRVEKDLLGSVTEAHEGAHNSWLDHARHYSLAIITIIFLGIILLVVRHKTKILVIFLALVLVSHLLPIKAIHASHSGPLDSQSYECCVPTAAVFVEPSVNAEGFKFFNLEFARTDEKGFKESFITLASRSPPKF